MVIARGCLPPLVGPSLSVECDRRVVVAASGLVTMADAATVKAAPLRKVLRFIGILRILHPTLGLTPTKAQTG